MMLWISPPICELTVRDPYDAARHVKPVMARMVVDNRNPGIARETACGREVLKLATLIPKHPFLLGDYPKRPVRIDGHHGDLSFVCAYIYSFEYPILVVEQPVLRLLYP
jgi:hypothetical protein